MSVISEVGKPLSMCVKKTFNRRQLSFRKSVARDRFLSTVTYSLMSFERSPHYSHSPSFLIFICIPCFACLFDINLLPNLFHSPPVSHVPLYYINLPVSIFSVLLLPFAVHASTLFCFLLLQSTISTLTTFQQHVRNHVTLGIRYTHVSFLSPSQHARSCSTFTSFTFPYQPHWDPNTRDT